VEADDYESAALPTELGWLTFVRNCLRTMENAGSRRWDGLCAVRPLLLHLSIGAVASHLLEARPPDSIGSSLNAQGTRRALQSSAIRGNAARRSCISPGSQTVATHADHSLAGREWHIPRIGHDTLAGLYQSYLAMSFVVADEVCVPPIASGRPISRRRCL
jgi:hypothetical protein